MTGAERLADIADRTVVFEPGTKSRGYYEIYDRYFTDLARPTATVLELGVYQGQSTKVLASYFSAGKIIAVDAIDRGLDFSAFSNVVFEQADQQSARMLRAIAGKHAPGGFDVIIDDASHIGAWSRSSYETLLPLLNPGGLYIIEDWATGYWGDWPDGRASRPRAHRGIVKWLRRGRLPSHDHGMVGFLKSIVDDLADGRTRSNAAGIRPPLEFIHIYNALAIARKAAF